MSRDIIYLDYMATTPCDPIVFEAMAPWFTHNFGNAGSAHWYGVQAEQAVEHARSQVASLLGCDAREVVWTSGATEANNLAIKGAVRFLKERGSQRRRIVTVSTEHKCVLEAISSLEREGYSSYILEVDSAGCIDIDELKYALKEPTALVSMMAVNNETGVMQDLDAVVPRVKQAGALMHVDMAQSFGKAQISLNGIDLASLSGHKIYGPKGIGALYIRRRPRVRVQPLCDGGGQERTFRSGTLPVPLIVGMGEASQRAQELCESENQRVFLLRKKLLDGIYAFCPTARTNAELAQKIPHVVNIVLPTLRPMVEVLKDIPRLACSIGSACSAGTGAPSYVLQSMGISKEEAQRSLRLSIGRFTSEDEIDCAVALLKAALGRDVQESL